MGDRVPLFVPRGVWSDYSFIERLEMEMARRIVRLLAREIFGPRMCYSEDTLLWMFNFTDQPPAPKQQS